MSDHSHPENESPVSARKIERVKKKSGEVVFYDEGNISRTISKAASDVGDSQVTLGEDLAGVVTMYLERYYEREIPTSDEIRKMVDRILRETGHHDVADSYAGGRETQPGTAPREDLFPDNFLLVEGATRDEVSTWGRSRISTAIVKEAGLDPAEADEIAGAVERRIFSLGQRRVSTTLIREQVNHELLVRGYGAHLRKQLVVGLPKYDLSLLIGGEGTVPRIDPDRLCKTIGETTMRQYALQEIFTRDVADAHLEGRFHVHGIESPLKLWWLSPSLAYLRQFGLHVPGYRLLEEPATTARAFTAQLVRVAEHARRFFSGGVEFLNINGAFASLEGNPKEEAEQLVSSLAGSIIGLELNEDSYASEVLELWRSIPGYPEWPDREVVIGSSENLLREACRVACERGGMLFLSQREGCQASRFSSGGNPERWFSLAQAVTLNLPQAFYRSETGSDFYAELEAAIDLAVRAHLQKRRLLERFVHAPTGTFGHELGWSSNGAGALRFDDFIYSIGISGLNEVVHLISGHEIMENETSQRLALRVASYIFFRIREESRKHGIHLSFEDHPAEEAASRFARIDSEMYARARGLFESVGSYTEGTHVRPSEEIDPFEALQVELRFQTLVPSARAVLPPVHRKRLSASDLYTMVRGLPAAVQLHVR